MADQFNILDQPSGVNVGQLLLPTAVKAASVGRASQSGTSVASLLTGRQSFQLIYLASGILVSNITFSAWTTAGGVMTNQWFSIYSLAGAKLAVTADDTSTAWAAFTTKTLAVASPYLVTAAGFYYLGVNVVAITVPSLAGWVSPAGYNSATPVAHGVDTVNTALTTPASAPATATITANSAAGGLLAYIT